MSGARQDEGRKIVMKRLVRSQKGYVLIAALLVLLVLGLISGPLLSYMVNGLRAGRVFETGAAELYAADAGVQDAVWRIPNAGLCPGSPTTHYTISGVNGKTVDVTVTLVNNVTGTLTYKITSIAVTDGGGNTAGLSSTQIEAYVAGTVTYCSILDYLVAIQGNLDDKGIDALEGDLKNLGIVCPTTCTECEKCGKAYDYSSDSFESVPRGCYGCIAVYNYPSAGWPTVGSLNSTYWEQVKNGTSHNSTIDLNGQSMTLPTGYRNGRLEILNKNSEAATLSLEGTLYITGITTIGMNGAGGKPNLAIELNGNTVFVASNSTGNGHEALSIGDWCTINGPGAIIAVGDIYFKPNGEAGANVQPVLVLSVSGTTTIQPDVNFLGTIAGKLDVNLGSGHASVEYPMGGFGPVNFPSPFEVKRVYGIASWEVSRQ
jgi:Tfp pilus assembly protein PilX